MAFSIYKRAVDSAPGIKKMRPVLVFKFMLGLANFSAMSWFTVFILTTLARPGHTAACLMRRAGTRTLQDANHNT